MARSVKLADGSENIEITVELGRSVSGPVGTLYRVVDFWSDFPTLEKYSIGGIVGRKLTQTFECFSGHD